MYENEGGIVENAIDNARKKDVLIISNGVNKESNERTLEFVDRYDEVRACLGIYPTDAVDLELDDVGEIIGMIRKNRANVSGIGEIGLDFKESENSEDKEKQEDVFRRLVKLAIELDLPMTVHSRKAEERCIEILEELGARKVIMHYFSGKLKLVEKISDNGWYLSIPTAIKSSEHFQKIVEVVDIKNLLCETDSPYSHPDKKFPNEPANVSVVYDKISDIKGIDMKEVEERIENNFKSLFGQL
jgi:TatD DNase family protein